MMTDPACIPQHLERIADHLDALHDHLGSAAAVCEAFNQRDRRLFELVYDEKFGVFLVRPA